MRLSPLQLNRYFITRLDIIALREYAVKKPVSYDFNNLQSDVKISKDKKKPGIFQVSLMLKHAPQAVENLPYSFSIQIIGFFEVHPQWPKEKIDELVRINGPAVLYGIAREIIAQNTGRGPWGSLLLPTVNFLPESTNKTKIRKRAKKG